MSKRVKNQITKDRLAMGGHESDDESPMPVKRASEDVLSKRPMAKFGKRFQQSKPAAVTATANGFKPSVTITTNAQEKGSSDMDTNQAHQLKSLNANFLKSVNDAITRNPVADLTPVVSKYLEYYAKIIKAEIEVRTLDVPTVDVKPISKEDESKPNPFAVFKSYAATPAKVEDPPAKVEVSPTEVTITPNSVQEPIKVDSDSEDEEPAKIEIRGPTFKLDKIPSSKDYSFKFGYVPPKDSDDSEDDIEIKGPSFQTNVKVQDGVFKLPKLGVKTQETQAKPEDQPAFTFGATNDKPATFGVTKADDKPTTFGFSSTSTEKKPHTTPFSFAPAKSDEKPAPAAFSFAPAKTETKQESAATNLFSFTPAKSEEKPSTSAFSFNPPKQDEKPTATAFSFTPAKPEISKPAFSFGSNESKSASNPFSFGGESTSTFSSNGSTAFSFSAPKPQVTPAVSATDSSNKEEPADETQKDEVKGNFALVKLTEKVDVKTGEEEEETLYVKRSKISKLKEDKSGYESIGLGELKVLKNKTTGKSRILVRSDGGLNIVLNVAINKDIKYELMGAKNNTLKIPMFTEKGIDTYIAQVKTSADAEELFKNVKSCQ